MIAETHNTANAVRIALKAAFPGAKFSITGKDYTGGSTITIRWVDGPASDDVTRVAVVFEKEHTTITCTRRITLAHLQKACDIICTQYGVTPPALTAGNNDAYALEDDRLLDRDTVAYTITRLARSMAA